MSPRDTADNTTARPPPEAATEVEAITVTAEAPRARSQMWRTVKDGAYSAAKYARNTFDDTVVDPLKAGLTAVKDMPDAARDTLVAVGKGDAGGALAGATRVAQNVGDATWAVGEIGHAPDRALFKAQMTGVGLAANFAITHALGKAAPRDFSDVEYRMPEVVEAPLVAVKPQMEQLVAAAGVDTKLAWNEADHSAKAPSGNAGQQPSGQSLGKV